MPPSLTIRPAESPSDYLAAGDLFREYSQSIGFSLCFQNFDNELNRLSSIYGPPDGIIYLVFDGDSVVGCGAVRKFDRSCAELKRMYLREAYRSSGCGRKLAEALMAFARSKYELIRLDTIEGKMDRAIELYRKLGFYEIPPYYHNPQPNVVYMEAKLTA